MRIPRYWIKASGQVPESRRKGELSAWGWSSHSEVEARQRAEQRLARLLERIQRGEPLPRAGYLYGDRPLREEIVDELRDRSPNAVITRNSYGCLVLNTDGAMFVDVDGPPAPRRGFLARLLGKGEPPDPQAGLAELRDALRSLPGSYRIYRTAAGWRVLATDRLYEPTSKEAQTVMSALDADPAYQRLCQVQESFRARLTPKPWRCGQPNPPGRFPRDDDRDRAAFQSWLDRYEEACRSRATCRFVEAIGPGDVDPRLSGIVSLHDRYTRAADDLPLA